MTPSASARPSWTLRPLLAATLLLLMTSLPVSAVEPETCFSRQHQNVIVNVRQALGRPTTATDARVVRSERDCVLACCSEEVKPGETDQVIKSESETDFMKTFVTSRSGLLYEAVHSYIHLHLM